MAEDGLDRRFEPKAPDRSWTADITHVATGEGWLYLAVVAGPYSRRIVGRSMGSRIDSRRVVDALEMALAGRSPGERLAAHVERTIEHSFEEGRFEEARYPLARTMPPRLDLPALEAESQ